MKLWIVVPVALLAAIGGYAAGWSDAKTIAARRAAQTAVIGKYAGPECLISVDNGKIRDTRLPMMKLAEQIPPYSPKVERAIKDLMDECTYAQYPLRQRLCDPSTAAQYDHADGWSCVPYLKP